jgi:transposase
MQDTALYQYLLGLQSPWTVSRVNLDVNAQRVDVWATHPEDAA